MSPKPPRATLASAASVPGPLCRVPPGHRSSSCGERAGGAATVGRARGRRGSRRPQAVALLPRALGSPAGPCAPPSGPRWPPPGAHGLFAPPASHPHAVSLGGRESRAGPGSSGPLSQPRPSRQGHGVSPVPRAPEPLGAQPRAASPPRACVRLLRVVSGLCVPGSALGDRRRRPPDGSGHPTPASTTLRTRDYMGVAA